MPPTKDPIGKKNKVNLREKSGLKSGGQPGHPGQSLEMQIPGKIEILEPSYCTCCGGAQWDIAIDKRLLFYIFQCKCQGTSEVTIIFISLCLFFKTIKYLAQFFLI